MECVDIGGNIGERLGQEDAQAKKAGVGIDNVDTALDSDSGGSRRRGTGEERLVEKRATGVKSETGDENASGNLLEFWAGWNYCNCEIGSPNLGAGAGARGEHRSIAGGSEIDGGFVCDRGGELIGRGCGPLPGRAAPGGIVGEEDLIAGGVGLN